MVDPGILAVERQAKDHGYTITLVVNAKGIATVTLKDSFTGNVFSADSGIRDDARRYAIALYIAVERMLDYQYRGRQKDRPALGVVL
jgi:hypothetical protein